MGNGVNLSELWSAQDEVDEDCLEKRGEIANNSVRLVKGRIYWKGKLRRLMTTTGGFALHCGNDQQGTKGDVDDALQTPKHKKGDGRFFFEAKLVDCDKNGVKLAFWSHSMKHYNSFEEMDCVAISSVLVNRRSEGSTAQRVTAQPLLLAVGLTVNDRSKVRRLTSAPQEDNVFPNSPLVELRGCATNFVSVANVLQSCAVGDVVSVQGNVCRLPNPPTTSTVHTKHGNVEKLKFFLRDYINPRFQIEFTLWGSHATEVAPTIKNGDVCNCIGVTVRSYGNSKTLSTRSSSEVYSEDHRHAKKKQPRPDDTTATATHDELRPMSKCSRPDPLNNDSAPSTFSFDLLDHHLVSCTGNNNHTSDLILLRIREIKIPLLYRACSLCGRKFQQEGTLCHQCHSSQSHIKFIVRMILSDSLREIVATGFSAIGESLFCTSVNEFVARCSEDGGYQQRKVDEVLGSSVFVKLVVMPEGDAHVTELHHPDFSQCSKWLCQLVGAYNI